MEMSAIESKFAVISLEASKAALKELKGRKGFAWWWDDIDPRDKEEIVADLATVIAKTMLLGGAE
jgi:hypothetical protein